MTFILKGLGKVLNLATKGLGILNKVKPVADLTGSILNSTGLGRKIFGTTNWARGYRTYNNVSNWISGDGTKAVNNAQNSLNRLNSLHH